VGVRPRERPGPAAGRDAIAVVRSDSQ
jgi:hypothetical protein